MTLDILAFGAHADDVELAASGTLMRAAAGGARTGVITLTRGEMGTRGTLELRAREFDEAAQAMSLAHHEMLSLPDSRLAPTEEARQLIVREIREHRPRIVLLPYPEDRHPDHGAASRIIQEAAFLAGLRKLETGQQPHRPAELIYYMASWEFAPSFVVDISDFIERKSAVLKAYSSQVYNPEQAGAWEPTFIASEHFMKLLFARMAHYGGLIGKAYGEPFWIRGMIEIDDLLTAFGDRTY